MMFQVLADNGWSIDYRNDFDETPLHLAVANNHVEVVREILQLSKSSVSEQDDYSRTPLHLASTYGHAEVVAELLKHGANPSD